MSAEGDRIMAAQRAYKKRRRQILAPKKAMPPADPFDPARLAQGRAAVAQMLAVAASLRRLRPISSSKS